MYIKTANITSIWYVQLLPWKRFPSFLKEIIYVQDTPHGSDVFVSNFI